MEQVFITTILCGVLAGISGSATVGGAAFSAFFPFLPLLYVGFKYGARPALHAGCIALLITVMLGGDAVGFNMSIFVVLPCFVLVQRLHMYRESPAGSKEWYSSLRALSELTLLIAFVVLTLSVMASHHYENGLREVLKRALPMENISVDTTIAELMQKLTGDWGFFLFAALSWFWLLTVWLLAWCTHELLSRQSQAIRPSIVIAPRGIPRWLMIGLLVSVAMVFVGNENDSYVGKVLFLVMLFPCFISGMAGVHKMSHNWKIRQLWLFLIYIILLFQPWSLVCPIGLGLYLYFSEMLDKPKKIR